MSLRIKPIKEDNDCSEEENVNPILPQMPFRLGLNSSTSTGKTTMIINLLLRCEFYYKKFDKIYIFSPSYFLDKKFKYLELPEENISEVLDEDKIIQVFEDQRENPKRKVLMIFDDLAESFPRTMGYSPFNKIFSSGRHSNMSVIITSQSYKKIPLHVRNQIGYWIFFKGIGNKAELQNIYNEQGASMTKKEFMALYQKATVKPYSFLYVNKIKNKYFKNFDFEL